MTAYKLNRQERKSNREAHLNATPEHHDVTLLKLQYTKSWVLKTLKSINDKCENEPDDSEANRLARKACKINLLTQFNKQIPIFYKYRLQSVDYKPFTSRADHSPIEVLEAFRSHASRLFGKMKRAIQREAELEQQKRKKVDCQVSEALMTRFQIDEFKKAEALETHFLPNGKPLSEVTQSPAAKMAELYAQINGLTKFLIDEQGCIAFFATMTCPSEYHSNPLSGDNSEWINAGMPDAKASSKWLNQRWRTLLRRLNKWQITPAGVTVTEPHADGCAHMHALLMVHPEQRHRLEECFFNCFPDNGANKLTLIEKGSDMLTPANYMLKTIKATEQSEKAQCWRKTNEIRAYNFFGISGFRGVWKWAFSMGQLAADPDVKVKRSSVNAQEVPTELKGAPPSVLQQLATAAYRGNGLAFFRLFNQHGPQLKRIAVVKETQRQVCDNEGNTIEVVNKMVEAGTIGYQLEDRALIKVAAKAVNTAGWHLVLSIQVNLWARETFSILKHAMVRRRVRASVFVQSKVIESPLIQDYIQALNTMHRIVNLAIAKAKTVPSPLNVEQQDYATKNSSGTNKDTTRITNQQNEQILKGKRTTTTFAEVRQHGRRATRAWLESNMKVVH